MHYAPFQELVWERATENEVPTMKLSENPIKPEPELGPEHSNPTRSPIFAGTRHVSHPVGENTDGPGENGGDKKAVEPPSSLSHRLGFEQGVVVFSTTTLVHCFYLNCHLPGLSIRKSLCNNLPSFNVSQHRNME
ncbi:unnamed protein product [Cuscuta campestris]|uniref:Uncharacterized protein n=1 Tax=Cuscuta campestris TaxID=132261 RepID=A0A484LUI9_9ASTE|nr:unnamed protein product [Cuscuta campestris]